MRLRLLAVGLVFVTFISYAQNPCAPPPSGSGPALAGMIADRPFALTIKVTVDQRLVGGNVIRGERIIREARDRSGRTLFKQQVGCFTADDGQTQPFFSVQVRDPGAHSLTTWSSDNPWNPKIVTVAYNFPHIDLQPPPRVSDLRHPRILASSPNHVMVDLGTRTIAGVETIGTRTTNIIPVGVRGNVQPLVSTTEVWRAEALDITLLEIQDDPIEGTKRFEVTEITQGDPDPAVFSPPANDTTEEKDYTAASAATFRIPVVPSCFGAWGINVGVMEQSPFTADFVHAEWQIAPDGTKARRVIMPGHIARDSEGRVAIQTPVRSHRAPSQADDAPDEVDEFATMVCDPHARR